MAETVNLNIANTEQPPIKPPENSSLLASTYPIEKPPAKPSEIQAIIELSSLFYISYHFLLISTIS